MDFTSEEISWLEEIASQVPEDKELSPLEQVLHDMAEPKTDAEGKLFELTAAIKFSLLDQSSCLPKGPNNTLERITASSRQMHFKGQCETVPEVPQARTNQKPLKEILLREIYRESPPLRGSLSNTGRAPLASGA
ncbi:hypothetical protein AGOR_G00049390 [Albula goreensis]|uniref:Uncharacterized protein n=1 Tax=Albula goreensis TaxID=1534307 RepID=A0A8T3DTF9_9TELE|nr:hypothetical protein AGOR_G00049390 [Albula goreensis]